MEEIRPGHKKPICAVIGGNGSIGRRYKAILQAYGYGCIVYDADATINLSTSEHVKLADKIIVASPTDTHLDYAWSALGLGKPVLIEKPLCKEWGKAIELATKAMGKDIYLVSNWRYIVDCVNEGHGKPYDISYNHYNTGKDGVWWDVCQILMLDQDADIQTSSPLWDVTINGHNIPVRKAETSYMDMIEDFMEGDYSNLWNMQDAADMVSVVAERINRESTDWDTSPKWLDKISG